ncbi:hypothetical protein ACQPZ2_39770 [Nocardia pseudovaccinii]|uniref:hypothetical protein n=1 Tax=Nocardia pseudovaccinii TaxID=189540 RepID=UPI003D8CA978
MARRVVIAAEYGYTAPNWVGVVLVVSALGLAFPSGNLERRGAETSSEPTESLVTAGQPS